jgi:hypothetical protein
MTTLHTVIETTFYKIPNKDLYQEAVTHWLVQKDENNKEVRRSFTMRTNGRLFVESLTERSAEGEIMYTFPDGTIKRLVALDKIRAGDAIRGNVF